MMFLLIEGISLGELVFISLIFILLIAVLIGLIFLIRYLIRKSKNNLPNNV